VQLQGVRFEPTLYRAHWMSSPTPYALALDFGLVAALLSSGGGSGGVGTMQCYMYEVG
jgi:hypothetical protein